MDEQAQPERETPPSAQIPPMPPATLRRWADLGQDAYLVERGSHRRVRPADLRALLRAWFD